MIRPTYLPSGDAGGEALAVQAEAIGEVWGGGDCWTALAALIPRGRLAAVMVSVKLIPVDPRSVLQAFDAHLAERQLRLEAVVIGGTALNLLGVVHRTTKDCDILHPSLPPAVVEAARDFAALRRSQGESLTDLLDCVALAPTAGELNELQPWLVTQDAAPEWPEHVRAVLEDLARRCGHGLQP
jgi:hypothetical protein